MQVLNEYLIFEINIQYNTIKVQFEYTNFQYYKIKVLKKYNGNTVPKKLNNIKVQDGYLIF